MQKRLMKVVKLFFIILGVMFFLILTFSFLAYFSISKISNLDFNIVGNSTNKLKNIQPIINYAEDYKEKNGAYPKEINNVKIKKDIDYKYEISKDANCYTITINTKKHNKTQQYQHCSLKSDNSNSQSESYIEFSN